MGANTINLISLEDKLKAENSVFLENCRMGDMGTVYAVRNGEAVALKGLVRDICVVPGNRQIRLYVILELVFSTPRQMVVFCLLNGKIDFYTVQ